MARDLTTPLISAATGDGDPRIEQWSDDGVSLIDESQFLVPEDARKSDSIGVIDRSESASKIKAKLERWRALLAEERPSYKCCQKLPKSLPGLCFILVRICMLISMGAQAFDITYYFSGQPLVVYASNLPILVGTIGVFVSTWSHLPQKFDEAIAHTTEFLDPNAAVGTMNFGARDVDKAALITGVFIIFSSMYCILASLLWETLGFYDTPGETAFDVVVDVILMGSTIPSLGAIIFTLWLDISRARKQIASLAAHVADKTLTVEQYRQVAKEVRRLNESWQIVSNILAFSALYNTVGMVVYLSHAGKNGYKPQFRTSYAEYTVLNDVVTVALMGKEAMLLFMFTSFSRLVNDEADDVVTDVFQWKWQIQLHPESETPTQEDGIEHGHSFEEAGNLNSNGSSDSDAPKFENLQMEVVRLNKKFENLEVFVERSMRRQSHRHRILELEHEQLEQEHRRLELIVEGANFSVLSPRDPRRRTSMCRRIISGKPGGMSFKVMGIRWTSRYVQALGVSFALSLCSVLYKYQHLED